jgi:leucyl aminopeptidase (aminopeptidase T)
MSWPQRDKISQSVLAMLQVNMGLQPGERLLVVSDVPGKRDWKSKKTDVLEEMLERAMLGRMVTCIVRRKLIDVKVTFHTFTATGSHGAEPDAATARRMLSADVILFITTYSLSHTNARTEATAKGARVASMPQFETSMLALDGPLAVDAQQVAKDVGRFAARLTKASQATVRTAYGTNLSFSLEGREGRLDDGLFTTPGLFGNLPAGEAYTAPLEGTGEGWLVVPAGWYPGLNEEMRLRLEKGLVVELQGGGEVGSNFRNLLRLDSSDPQYLSRRNLAELGIGCNPNARRPDNVLEAEKIKGTVHIAIGDSAHIGGVVNADLHEDFVQPQPDLILDGKPLILNGEWQF